MGKKDKTKTKKRTSGGQKTSKLVKKDIYQYEDDKSAIRNMKERSGVDFSDDSSGSDDDRRVNLRGDDESVDDDGDDIGWNSEDEVAFGKFFNRRRDANEDDNEDDEDEESDQEEAGDGEMLLSDILFGGSTSSSSKKKVAKASARLTIEEEDGEEEDEEVEEGEQEEDGEGAGDDGSDDGFDYGDEDEEEGEEEDEEEEEEDEEAYRKMLSSIEKFSKSESSSSSKKHKVSENQSSVEGRYSSMTDAGDLTMDTLLGALQRTKGLSAVKQKLADLEESHVAPVYLEKTVANRIERTLTYDRSKEEMKKWQDFVVTNRNAKTLDLAQDVRAVKTYSSLVTKFEPSNDMEKEIQMVLISSNKSETEIENDEKDQLEARNFNPEEIAARQAELGKVKALLFYDQMKRARINKIKSKAFHRILKRKRLSSEKRENELMAGDEEHDDAQDDADATQRIKERMNLKHQNTSKWAKMAVQYGQSDKSLREAYHESVALGQELKSKIDDAPKRNASRAAHSDSDASDDDDGGGYAKESSRAAAKIRSVLGESAEPTADGRYKKLLDMDFMKKALQVRQSQARQDASNILKELVNMEGGDSDSGGEDESPAVLRAKSQPKTAPSAEDKKRQNSAKVAVNEWMQSDGSMSFKVPKGGVVVAGPIKLKKKQQQPENADAADGHSNPWITQPDSKRSKLASTQNKVCISTAAFEVPTSSRDPQPSVQMNLVPAAGGPMKAKRGGKSTNKQTAAAPAVNAAIAATAATGKKEIEQDEARKASNRKPLMIQQSQEDLVQLAFAGPDLEEEFMTNKRKTVDEELGIDAKKMQIISQVKAGWGDWTGPGETGISQSTIRKRDRLLKRAETEAETKRDTRKDNKVFNVLISDRRIKTASKFKISDIPHPFTTREDYEQSLRVPIGDEWNASHVVQKTTKPEILKRAGRIIETPKLSQKRQRVFNPHK